MFREVLRQHREEILRIAARYGATNVRMFGSIARGEERPDSDVDLLVNFDPNRSLLDHMALEQDLEKLLGRKVEVGTDDALHWYVRERILQQAIPL